MTERVSDLTPPNDATAGYAQLKVVRKTGAERFHYGSVPLDSTLLDFWSWSASDLVNNSMRGVLAEYIVASALGLANGTRIEWDAFDLQTYSGVKIEVKSAAYLQSWYHPRLSAIRFNIRPTRAWEANTNEFSSESRRQADVYVFCLLAHIDKASLDPLDVSQWEFYILKASILDTALPTQKSVSLSGLMKLNPIRANYNEIAACIQSFEANP